MLRIVLDTNIYISAFVFGGKIRENILDIIEDCIICSSDALIQEIFITLDKKKFSVDQVTRLEIAKFLSEIELFHPENQVDICRDPKDNFVLELAEEAKADFIITGDKDLLVLTQWKDCKILSLRDFLDL